MKRILIAGALALVAGGQALAADLPPPAPAPRAPAVYLPVAPPYNWSGFYIGGNLGYGFGSSSSLSDSNLNTFSSTTSSSFLGGGQVGVNYEFWGGVVIGAEADFDWLPNTKNTISVTGMPTASATINDRWLTTATGRLGYAWDRVLFYGKGGGAWVGASNPSASVGTVPVTFTSSNSGNFGWTAGLGVEWAFWGNWSARAEWDYIRLQSQTFTAAAGSPVPFGGGDIITNNNPSFNVFTAGVNYKFGGWW